MQLLCVPSVCTFHNNPENSKCDMCGTALQRKPDKRISSKAAATQVSSSSSDVRSALEMNQKEAKPEPELKPSIKDAGTKKNLKNSVSHPFFEKANTCNNISAKPGNADTKPLCRLLDGPSPSKNTGTTSSAETSNRNTKRPFFFGTSGDSGSGSLKDFKTNFHLPLDQYNPRDPGGLGQWKEGEEDVA